MQELFQNYIQSISAKFSHPETSEMGYRTDFEILLKGIFESIHVKRIDHDARAREGNKPDFVVVNHDLPILYIEAKDIGVSLDKIEKSEQMTRYFGYANLVLTDYIEFRFYRNGLRYEDPIAIANLEIKSRIISPIPDNYEHVVKTLLDFAQSHKEPIRSGKHLAKIMGGKAQRIRDNVRQYLAVESQKNTELVRVYETIKRLLVHDLTPEAFADMYAQTLVYGLFVARYHDVSTDTFTRQEARELVPRSNPFLRHFFDHIVGADFDKRLEYIVDELCEVFSHADVQELMRQYFRDDLWGNEHEGPDPVIHFYEDFLKEYDSELRKKLGAFFTPIPVVRFIVRSVDYLLKGEFGLRSGLADVSKHNETHRVQILDPAVGTGTFLSAVIREIYAHILKNGQKGRWPSYVHNDLLPRLHGFELMMAPYTIAHLKLGMAFEKTGFKHFNRRLGIYLTNSLEESVVQENLFTGFGFAESIAEESKEASVIKNQTPIMVVLGNPPYSVSSSNKGKWITNLIKDYKLGLGEKNIQPLSDDYIKFLRFAEHFIEKNSSGIVAMITNNSFLDGRIHRQMRKHLLEIFDNIYILDLHGNAKKKEISPNGGKDENIFDIQQGVAISIFVRKVSDIEGLGIVHHADLYGKRSEKFEKLDTTELSSIKWKKLDSLEPYYFFVPKNFELEKEYQQGFRIDEIFKVFNAGTATGKDSVFVKLNGEEILASLRSLNETYPEDKIVDYLYRPFDIRKMPYDTKLVQRLRTGVMDHMRRDNLALITSKKQTTFDFQHVFATNTVTDRCAISLQTGEVGYLFPIYTYNGDMRDSNLNSEVVLEIERIVGKTQPEDIFDYVYAVLHSPSFRKRYKEFLKIDFPRVPYPKDAKSFRKFVSLGAELRKLHLLESPELDQLITTFPVEGTDIVEDVKYWPHATNTFWRGHEDEAISHEAQSISINKTQFFGNVPGDAWNFYIGGYQPAQKWLKDRRGRQLTSDDIVHYQKIVKVLVETDKLMREIDKVGFE